MRSSRSWIEATPPEYFGYPDDDDDYDEDDWCPKCGTLLPTEREEDRRIVGPPDGFHDTEVRPLRRCRSCGYCVYDQDAGWYE